MPITIKELVSKPIHCANFSASGYKFLKWMTYRLKPETYPVPEEIKSQLPNFNDPISIKIPRESDLNNLGLDVIDIYLFHNLNDYVVNGNLMGVPCELIEFNGVLHLCFENSELNISLLQSALESIIKRLSQTYSALHQVPKP